MADADATTIEAVAGDDDRDGTAGGSGFLAAWGLLTCGAIGVVLLVTGAYVLLRDGGDSPLPALIVTGGIL